MSDPHDLKRENAALRDEVDYLKGRIDRFERGEARQRKATVAMTQASWWLLAGPELDKALRRWLTAWLDHQRVDVEASADVAAAVIRRIFRVGTVGLLVALAPTVLLMLQLGLMWQQNTLIESQNRFFAEQNAKLERQIGTQEGQFYQQRRAELLATLKKRKPCNKPSSSQCDFQHSRQERSQALADFVALEREHRKGHLDLADIPLEGIELKDADLHDAHLPEGNLDRANLERANLVNVNAKRASFQTSNLTGADLQGASLVGSDMQSAVLTGAKLQRAILRGADLRKVDLTGANLTGADLTETDLKGVNLERARLNNAELTDADLSMANLTGARLTNADLARANLAGARLRDADLKGADLRGAQLHSSQLTGAVLTDARYDARTTWPASFTPEAHGAIRVPSPH